MNGVCSCYVSELPHHITYAMRNGPHDRICPIFRVSLDSVDRMKDADIRAYWTSNLYLGYEGVYDNERN